MQAHLWPYAAYQPLGHLPLQSVENFSYTPVLGGNLTNSEDYSLSGKNLQQWEENGWHADISKWNNIEVMKNVISWSNYVIN